MGILNLVIVDNTQVIDIWGIDFMGHFPSSCGYHYIKVIVVYVSCRVEARALPTNDAMVVAKFFRKAFLLFRNT